MMKAIKFLLACIVVLLVIGIFLLIDDRNNSSETAAYDDSSEVVDFDCENYDVMESPSEHHHMAEPVKHNEKVVTCKACCGMGHNSYEEINGECTVCNGAGRMTESKMLRRYNEWAAQEIPCSMCGGTGLSYEARVTGLMNIDLLAPKGYYDCKACKGKGKGKREDLMENFRVARIVYGAAM